MTTLVYLDTVNVDNAGARAGTPARTIAIANALARAGERTILVLCDRGLVDERMVTDCAVALTHPRDFYDAGAQSRLVKRFEVDRIISCEAEYQLDVASHLADSLGATSVYDVHDDDAKVASSLGESADSVRGHAETQSLAMKSADIVLTTTPHEYELAQRQSNGATLINAPNGCEISRPAARVDVRSRRLVFFGNMNYPPNKLAVESVCRIAETTPDVEYSVFGTNSTDEQLGPNVKSFGYMRDLNDGFNGNALAIAPIIYGAGAKMKLRDYCVAALPVLSTSEGASGMPASEGIVVEDDLEAWPGLIRRLLRRPERLREMGEANRCLAEGELSWSSVGRELLGALENATKAPRRGQGAAINRASGQPRWKMDNGLGSADSRSLSTRPGTISLHEAKQ